MSERKNIDRLFQEKFKDFEEIPSEEVWVNIEAQLDEKKKRRVIPFWWKLSGVAAVFLIGFLVSKSIYDDNVTPVNPIVKESNSNPAEKSKTDDINKKDLKINSGVTTEDAVVDKSNSTKSNQNSADDTPRKNRFNNNEDAVVINPKETKINTASGKNQKTQKTHNASISGVADRKPTRKRSLKNSGSTDQNQTPLTEATLEKTNNLTAENQNKNSQSTAKNDIVQNDSQEKTNKETLPSIDKKAINFDDLKGTTTSNIATKEVAPKANDTATAITSVATNELEELLNEKESKLKKESKRSRWQLASNVAPVFLGSVSNGSPIDSTLSKNSKSYNTNVGFGIGVSYAVNNKFSIRTGLNKVNLSYDTNDISFFRGMQAKTLSGVQHNAASAMIHVESNSAANTTPSSEIELLPFETTFVNKSVGSLKQEMGYLEMPVEMTYNVLDKKFGIKIIGGFSTLFLQENSISIISENRDTALGKANNLNDVHFSTNFGLGFRYSFLKSFEFNVDPTVKYQVNTFNGNAGSFKPYLFGIYSGISYKF
ncbi:hypothetical protein [Flavobacterium sp. 25HG05S-40]|uniref:hypothetical protein n=1 Tax=Flavobacterium sp. 25HG05S-40 TaxID=3458682 RepID=UPI00404462BD